MSFRSESYLKTVLGIFSFAFLFAFIFGGMDEGALSYYCKSGQLCYDTGSPTEFSVPVYTCSSGVCSVTRTEYFNCMFSPPSTCTQSPTSTPGYESYNACMGDRDFHESVCQARYPCLLGRCRGGTSRTCGDVFDCDCSSYTTPYYTCGAGSAYSGICCVDGSDPGYCLPGSCVDCTKTCNTGERLEATICTPRSASCNKINDCTGAVCGTVTFSCYPIGTCQDCTPTAPTNYHDPLPGENPIYNTSTCITSSTCNKSTTCGVTPCGSPSTVTKTFYLNEPNTKPSPPENLIIDVDGWKSPALSTVASSPTLIKYPYPSSSTSTSIKEVTSAPSGSGAYGWELYIGSTLITPRKVFNTTPPFNVYGSFPSISWLTQGYSGTYRAQYYTRDFCDGDELRSDPLMGYFKVNTLPVSMATITGSGGEPQGCSPEAKFTGREANRTLSITVSGTDIDNINSINGVILWLVKDGNNISSEILARTYVGPSDAFVNPNKFGLFINTGGTVYMTMNSGATFIGWGRNGLDGGNIVHPVLDGDRNVIISNVQLVSHGFNLATGKYEFIITLEFPDNSPLSGHYTLYTALTDTLSYVSIPAGMSLDQRNVTSSGRDWNFDFVNPTIGTINTNVEDVQQRLIDVNLTSTDDQGVIKDTVLNIYISLSPKEVKYIDSSPFPTPTHGEISQTPYLTPPDGQPGLISPLLSGWHFDSQQQSFRINIQNNSSGNLTFYPTVYDRACNFVTSQSNAIDLNKWIVTKGGILFSSGNIGFSPKDISDDWNIGTEMIGIGSNLHPVKLDNGVERNPVSITNIIDRNNQNKTAFYDLLVERANLYKKKFNYPVYTEDMNLCLTQCASTIKKICVCQPTSDFTFSTDTTFNGKILILTTKNINIQANITPSSPDSALIILTSGKVNIGKVKSGVTSFGTDTINAFIISLGGIDILSEIDTDPGIQQDQVVVNGGLIGLSEAGNAINILRNLGLMNISQPTLIVNYEPRYAKISELFFGTDTRVYKQDVGFKM